MKKMKLTTIEDWTIDISASLIFILMVLTVIDVMGRYFFNHPLKGNVEISRLLLMVSMLLPIAYIQRRSEHIGVDILTDWLKRYNLLTYNSVKFSGLILSEMAFVVVLIYCVIDLKMSVMIRETTEGPLYVIVWPAKALLCIGLLFINVRLLAQAFEAIKSISSRSNR